MSWQETTRSTNPGMIEMTSLQVIVPGYDVTLDLAGGETPSAPATRLIRLDNGMVIPLVSTPTLNGNMITQVISGPGDGLLRGVEYELTWVFAGLAPNKPSRVTVIRVVA